MDDVIFIHSLKKESAAGRRKRKRKAYIVLPRESMEEIGDKIGAHASEKEAIVNPQNERKKRCTIENA
jgi:hypothetical protein